MAADGLRGARCGPRRAGFGGPSRGSRVLGLWREHRARRLWREHRARRLDAAGLHRGGTAQTAHDQRARRPARRLLSVEARRPRSREHALALRVPAAGDDPARIAALPRSLRMSDGARDKGGSPVDRPRCARRRHRLELELAGHRYACGTAHPPLVPGTPARRSLAAPRCRKQRGRLYGCGMSSSTCWKACRSRTRTGHPILVAPEPSDGRFKLLGASDFRSEPYQERRRASAALPVLPRESVRQESQTLDMGMYGSSESCRGCLTASSRRRAT